MSDHVLVVIVLGVVCGVWYRLRDAMTTRGCLLGAIYWYVFVILAPVSLFLVWQMAMQFNMQPYNLYVPWYNTPLAWFIFAFILPNISPFFTFLNDVFERFSRWVNIRNLRKAQRAQQKQQQEASQRPQNERKAYEQYQYEQEQQRRKEEAKKRREEHNRHEETENTQNQNIQPPEEPDHRSDEDILGLSLGYTLEDLKKAYRHECQRLHPDRWAGKPQAIRDEMEKEFKKVQRAYNRLMKKFAKKPDGIE